MNEITILKRLLKPILLIIISIVLLINNYIGLSVVIFIIYLLDNFHQLNICWKKNVI